MKKALMVATVGGFFRFELSDIKILKDMGYEVHCASNFVGDQKSAGVKGLNDMGDVKLHQIDFARSPFSSNTLKAYKQLKRLLSEEKFELIHCHTPVGGILTRLAARKYRKHGTKVFYTAHGFHFFEGAPLANWLLFYPVEWLCSWWTDVLLTINQEDYKRAKNKFHAKKTVYIPGVGIDLEKFRSGNVNRVKKRKELGLKKTDKMLLSVGELSKRKNHELVLKALAEIKNPNIKYFICGNGSLANELQHLTETLNITEQVKFLGYRNDISELCQSADLYVFPSLQEGLPVALMEAIACKTPVICSKIRGSTDLVKDSDYLFHTNEATELASCIEKALSQDNTSAVEENYNTLLAYDLTNVAVHMNELYRGIFEAGG